MILEQLLDLRLRTLPNGSGDKPQVKDYTLISIMLGEITTRNSKIYFNLPEWDYMCERPTIKTKIPYRYALAIEAVTERYNIENPRRVFRDQGFPSKYNKAYSTLKVEGKEIDLDKVVRVNDGRFSTLCIKAKLFTGRYNDVFFDTVFNPFFTWLEYYENGIILNPENIIYTGVIGKPDQEYIEKVKKGFNPEMELTMKKPFNVMELDQRFKEVIRHVYMKDIAGINIDQVDKLLEEFNNEKESLDDL